MENTRYNGLAGKARRTRDLNRATRMYAQQMIEEYLYPEPDTWRPERYIPIRGRSEFLPSAAFISEDQDAPTQRQLDLPLIAAGAARECTSDQTVERSTVVAVADEPRRDSVIRPLKPPFQAAQQRKQKQSPFTRGGFFFGCAVGSAAAAMVLLVVRLAVG